VDLERQYDTAILMWEAQDVLRWLNNRDGNAIAEQHNIDRMRLLGIVAHDLQRQISGRGSQAPAAQSA
jgi:hypothetical protein